MRKELIVIGILACALVVSNVYWLYRAIDTGITMTYREVACQDNHAALDELITVAPVAARSDATRESVLEMAKRKAREVMPFDKEGFTWVGHLGYRFDDQGRLVEITPSWSPF